ncbi:MAG: SanA protein, partial [Cyclobacteriaceae bacterium]
MKGVWRVVKYFIFSIVATIALIVALNFWVIISTEDQVYHQASNLPVNKVGLILGTSKRTSAGDSNKYFHERINAAAELYHLGKIQHLIVSGDNRTVYYNEPRDMYMALVNLNVPKGAITLDFAGLRTLDTIVRADAIFGQKRFTIITQDFHCYRSLFIANYYGFEAMAFSADDKEKLPLSLALREILARCGAVLDLYVWKKAPTI